MKDFFIQTFSAPLDEAGKSLVGLFLLQYLWKNLQNFKILIKLQTYTLGLALEDFTNILSPRLHMKSSLFGR